MIAHEHLSRCGYRDVLDLQLTRREGILNGSAKECIYTVEHDSIISIGKRNAQVDLDTKIEIIRTKRGGLATFHGPGQLIVYPIIHLAQRKISVRRWVHGLESVVLAVLTSWGIQAHRNQGHPGVWYGGQKLCAVGLHISRGVSIHGIALNLTIDLKDYAQIEPCGLPLHSVGRVADHIPFVPALEAAALAIVAEIQKWLALEST